MMRSGSRAASAWAVSFLWIVIGVAAQGIADDRSEIAWTIEQVAASVKERREPSVSFEEATYSSLLTKPLITRGVLRFTPPSRLEKDVREPYRERYVIDGDFVTIESERRNVTKTVSLDEYPGLRWFVDTFRAVLDGDVARLTKEYDAALEGTKRRWILRVRPRDRAGGAPVDFIELSGSEGRINAITVRTADGDRSVMTLSPGPGP
ncbi:MAG: outer membrane lipoprotein carrier protein LolA [Nitrospira sp.]|nr:outer membrane lipoprotein carrier protein LolA [Nitrospira sp.]MCP9475105.1 outer membrane lipoprotein carrier protein LolA [Nitrospira sp.]